MRSPAFLTSTFLRYLVLLSAALLVAILGVVLASGRDKGGETTGLTSDASNLDAPLKPWPTPSPEPTAAISVVTTPEPSPTAEPETNRENCDAIRGTAYESDSEREWYLGNCLHQSATSPSGSPSSASSGSRDSSGSGDSGVQSGLGPRLVIPAAGVNAPVTSTSVGPDGAMPDPVGYFNAVLYDFPNHPGLGGRNKVLAGHVDCARCNGGGPGTAVFYSIRGLGAGSTAQWVNANGTVENYVVTASYSVSASADFSEIVSSSAADMTLITCTGSFSSGDYDRRHVVQLRRV